MKVLNWLLCIPALCVVKTGVQAAEPPLVLEATVPLPGVKGRIDHMGFDSKRNRLLVAALGNDTVEVIDTAKNRRERSLPGFGEPQGILYVPETDRVYVGNATANRVDILDAASFSVLKQMNAEDADNVRLDASARKAIVGYGSGALRMIDLTSEETAHEIKLPAHPESFQLEQKGPRIFVNVPKAHQVTVVDREKKAVVGKWDIGLAAANFPMALDEDHGRLFVGARLPAVMLVYDIAKGDVVAKLSIGGDTDDLFYDKARSRVYVICGEGRVDVFAQESPDRYSVVASMQTAPRARTGLFVPATGRLYVAAPAVDGAQARILVYSTQ
jgi:DNA-binding beta-propeller fold protein YncE